MIEATHAVNNVINIEKWKNRDRCLVECISCNYKKEFTLPAVARDLFECRACGSTTTGSYKGGAIK